MQSLMTEEIKTAPKQEAEEKMNKKIAKCSHCGSTEVIGYSRVVGYFSMIDNWNKSKLAEFKDRQKGNYSIKSLSN